jgi:hypothetical protein
VKTDGEGNGRGWWGVENRVLVVVYTAVQKRKRGRVWAKNAKPSGSGSISGMLCQKVVKRGGRRWWCASYDVTVVVGWLVQRCEWGRGVWAKNVKQGSSSSILGMLGQAEGEGGAGVAAILNTG